jgi:hypothetical protein
VTVVGAVVLAAGVAMLALPGPGILVIALGFAILGTEYAWAAAAFEKTKRGAEHAGRFAKGAVKSASGRVRKRPGAGGPPGTEPSPGGPPTEGPQGNGPPGPSL